MSLEASFYGLNADHILNTIEAALGRTEIGKRATGRLNALNSLENRVYQIEFEDDTQVVAKFYRPARWNKNQIKDEHDFLLNLERNEIPVVAPMTLEKAYKNTLGECSKGIYFAVFPFVRGRCLDEYSPENLEVLGRYIARIHLVGQSMKSSRSRLDVENNGYRPLELLKDTDFFETDSVRFQYLHATERFLELAEQRLEGAQYILTHGDCHLGNTLWRDNIPFFLDFDDMCFAPAVQDIWMVIRGRDARDDEDRKRLVGAYQQMRDFRMSELDLIEVLRGLRIITHSSWIAHRWADPSFQKAFADFGKTSYWHEETAEISSIIDILEGLSTQVDSW